MTTEWRYPDWLNHDRRRCACWKCRRWRGNVDIRYHERMGDRWHASRHPFALADYVGVSALLDGLEALSDGYIGSGAVTTDG